MEVKHGVQLGEVYANDTSAGVMIYFIGDSIAWDLKNTLKNPIFFSLLMDGSTDASVTKKQAIFVVVFNPTPPKTNEIKVEIMYLNLANLVTADAPGIICAIDFSFESISFENWHSKLVGYGSDGASVNCGKKRDVKTILQNDCEWLTFGWCVAHFLELALKDSLGKTAFLEVDELILCMYYLYKKSPKKLQQLKELVNVCQETYEFKAGGVCRKKASGLHLLLIVYIEFKYHLFNSELSSHVHILVMFLLVKVIVVLDSHIKPMSLCEHIKMRSSHRTCSVRKDVLTELSLRPATLLKKRLWYRCFPHNFVKFL